MHPFLTIAEASALIAARKLSPVKLTRTCLDRIAAHDATLHSFLLVTRNAPSPMPTPPTPACNRPN